MRIVYVGNFDVTHSTETHVAQALTDLGHDVTAKQESTGVEALVFDPLDFDLILWTRTLWPWDEWGIGSGFVHDAQRRMLDRAAASGVPTVGFHLDRWWGLPRQSEVFTEPFFRVSRLITADGGSGPLWLAHGINHTWMPPAISLFECEPGTPNVLYEAAIAFVGSWQDYHPEWPHRAELVDHLRGLGARFWPNGVWPGPDSIVRDKDLRDLYATTQVNVGDSCLIGGIDHYWSDRIPETLGRGGFLLHPNVVGLDEHFTLGEHLVTWDLGDWAQLDGLIAQYRDDPEARRRIAAAGKQHVMAHHTYHDRMRSLLELV